MYENIRKKSELEPFFASLIMNAYNLAILLGAIFISDWHIGQDLSEEGVKNFVNA